MVSVLVASKVKGVGVVGPLFDGAIVSRHALPALVRATAINANIALRSRALGIEVRTGIGQSDFLFTLQKQAKYATRQRQLDKTLELGRGVGTFSHLGSTLLDVTSHSVGSSPKHKSHAANLSVDSRSMSSPMLHIPD